MLIVLFTAIITSSNATQYMHTNMTHVQCTPYTEQFVFVYWFVVSITHLFCNLLIVSLSVFIMPHSLGHGCYVMYDNLIDVNG